MVEEMDRMAELWVTRPFQELKSILQNANVTSEPPRH